jgi:hypothetical protein
MGVLLALTILAAAFQGTYSEGPRPCLIEYRGSGGVCFLMTASMELMVTYNTTSKNYSVTHIPVTCDSFTLDTDESYCNRTFNKSNSDGKNFKETKMVAVMGNNSQFTLGVDVMANYNPYHYQWNVSNITIGLNLSSVLDHFPNISKAITSKTISNDTLVEGYIDSSLFGTVDYYKYYLCHVNRSYALTTIGDAKLKNDIFMVLTMKDLRVQAVQFEDKYLSVFDDSYSQCYQDFNNTPPVIPIVIGSVIGALVLVVLAIYIGSQISNKFFNKGISDIGRLTTEKIKEKLTKQTYEKL